MCFGPFRAKAFFNSMLRTRHAPQTLPLLNLTLLCGYGILYSRNEREVLINDY
nr:MAG TPA: hypothetical protein [Caudoviricetes sp.]